MSIFRLTLTVLCMAFCLNSYAQSNDYVLDTGDTISIRVHGEPDLTFDTKISTSGKVLYPFLGEIKVAGHTTEEVRKLIYGGLIGDYLLKPEVDVNVIEYRPFYILGEVQSPKNYPYQPGLTLSQAIAIAGGLTERGSLNGIELKRKLQSGSVQLFQDVGMDELLQPGDVVTVKQSFF
ncbi:MAG: capsular biosynthesis protein [Blastomonas sp.]|nr:capsular biosynthesis protein [Blastomonas sp.]|tara:strand:- start:17331 stop:17864 length:534 start_codon:yes stop_codon:yes gene_type:complete